MMSQGFIPYGISMTVVRHARIGKTVLEDSGSMLCNRQADKRRRRQVHVFILSAFLLAGISSCAQGVKVKPLKVFQSKDPDSIFDPANSERTAETSDSSMLQFAYDNSGYVLLFRSNEMCIDEFRRDGGFVRRLAGGDTGSARLPTFISMAELPGGQLGVVTDREFLTIDLESGKFKETELPQRSLGGRLRNVLGTRGGAYFGAISYPNGLWKVAKIDMSAWRESIIHEDRGRMLPEDVRPTVISRWTLRMEEDFDGHLLIVDQSQYRIWVYGEDGKLVRKVDIPYEAEPITESDLYIRSMSLRLPIIQLYSLPEAMRYFPAIVGIQVTNRGNRLVFTSFRNRHSQFRIDVYDSDWNYVGSDYQYNVIGAFPYQVAGEELLVADLGFLGEPPAWELSHLEAPEIPKRLLFYKSRF